LIFGIELEVLVRNKFEKLVYSAFLNFCFNFLNRIRSSIPKIN